MILTSSLDAPPVARRVFAVCAGLLALGYAGAAAADPTLSIEARLFGAKTGRFSKNVLVPDPPLLGNVIIGENASSSTFVIVRVAADAPLAKTARVRLVATGMSREDSPRRPSLATGRLLDSAVYLPGEAVAGETHVGFWLPDTGCAPIALKAELQDPPRRTVSATAKLEFRCYE